MPAAIVNGVELFYEDRGPCGAPSLVLSHSLFFDHRMFEAQLKEFSRTYRVIAYDHRGHGLSANAADGRYDMDTMAADVVALIEHLNLGRVHIVGNSMGGFIALRLAARRPDLVCSAAVLGSSAEPEAKAKEYEPLLQLLAQQGGAGTVETLMFVMFGDTTLAEFRKVANVRHLARPNSCADP